MDYIGAAISDIGLVKQQNQDSACLRIIHENHAGESFIMAVCDGVSSLKNGEKASADAIRQLLSWYEKDISGKGRKHMKQSDLISSLINETNQINSKIFESSVKNGISTGTTMTCMASSGDRYVISHVGDSRIYRVGKRSVQALTIDQTLTRKRINDGVIDASQAFSDDGKHVLLQCIGGGTRVTPEIITGRIKRGDMFLACSDGIYNTVSDEELFDVFAGVGKDESILKDRCSRIISECKRRGECDNMTIAVIKSI